MNPSIYKIALIGDNAVGKTTFVKRHLTGEFTQKYIRTLGVNVDPLSFNTNKGYVTFNIWDFDGSISHNSFNKNYFCGVDAVIIMFDVQVPQSYINAFKWYDLVTEKLGKEIPIVICGNKAETNHYIDRIFDDRMYENKNCHYNLISAKSNYNFEKPFLHILQTLKKDSNIGFTENVPITPPKLTAENNKAIAEIVNENKTQNQDNGFFSYLTSFFY